jgi:hypothetical protein
MLEFGLQYESNIEGWVIVKRWDLLKGDDVMGHHSQKELVHERAGCDKIVSLVPPPISLASSLTV